MPKGKFFWNGTWYSTHNAMTEAMKDRFQLEQPKPPKKKYVSEPARQNVLFAGLDCLAGQGDLFLTDGKEKDREYQTPISTATER